MMAGLPRTNCWSLAEHACEPCPPRDAAVAVVRVVGRRRGAGRRAGWVVRHLGASGAILVIDETCDVKKGPKCRHRHFGPAFIKVGAYFPYPAKIWVTGHEWAKRQWGKAGIGYRELSNGFAACDGPAALQKICDALRPATIEAFAHRWLHRLPLPFGPDDQRAGTGGNCRCVRSRSPAPSCWMHRAGPARSSRH